MAEACWNCKSTNYVNTLNIEECSDCGIGCDYWGGGSNQEYNAALERKYAREEDERYEKERKWREEDAG